MTTTEAADLGKRAAEIVRSQARTAIRYAEAYEPSTTVLVVDGSAYSPSTRAVSYAEDVFQSSYGEPEVWEAFEDAFDRGVDAFELEDGSTDSEAPDMWSLTWEDGCLWAVLPDQND